MPSSVPTAVPTMPASTEPMASGTKILRKPPISTLRSMLRMLPTMMPGMNRYRKLLCFQKATMGVTTDGGNAWVNTSHDGRKVTRITGPPMLRKMGMRCPISMQVKLHTASRAMIGESSAESLPVVRTVVTMAAISTR